MFNCPHRSHAVKSCVFIHPRLIGWAGEEIRVKQDLKNHPENPTLKSLRHIHHKLPTFLHGSPICQETIWDIIRQQDVFSGNIFDSGMTCERWQKLPRQHQFVQKLWLSLHGHKNIEKVPDFRVKKVSQHWIVDDRHPLGAKVNTREGRNQELLLGDIDKYTGLDK